MRPALWVALVVAALGAAAGVYVTSERPDGLERVTADLALGAARAGGADGGAGKAAAPRSRARRAALALVGALAVAGVCLGVGRLLSRARRPRGPER